MGLLSKLLDFLRRRHAGPPPVAVKALTSGRAVFRISGIERVPFGNGPGELDNWIWGTLLWRPGLAEGPALELALRGVEDKVAIAKPVGGKVGITARWSPNLAHDNRLYRENKLRPDTDYLGQGIGYAARLPLGPAQADGSRLVTVEWGLGGVVVRTPAGSTALTGKHPAAAAFGYWHPGALTLGWGNAAQDATRKGLRVSLESWTAVGPQGDRIIVP